MLLNFGIFAAVCRKMSATIRIEGAGRIDVRVADHELLEDVVLDGPGSSSSFTPCSSAATM
jgi:hypothetical protein